MSISFHLSKSLKMIDENEGVGGVLGMVHPPLCAPRPSGYENVANFEIPFFLWNLVTIS